jgi:hypothetical protein
MMWSKYSTEWPRGQKPFWVSIWKVFFVKNIVQWNHNEKQWKYQCALKRKEQIETYAYNDKHDKNKQRTVGVIAQVSIELFSEFVEESEFRASKGPRLFAFKIIQSH